MILAHLMQVSLEFLYRGIAFSLVACRDNEDKGLVLGTRQEKFVDQASSNA
jgi:hypothetical protein